MSLTPSRRMIACLSRARPACSLAVFRMAFGALMMWDCWRFIRDDRVSRYWIAPEFHFHYPGFSWVRPLSEAWLELAWIAMGTAALFVMLGLFYRAAIIAFTLIFAYFFLLDAAEYLNHFYLVLLYALILCGVPAARVWSLDAWGAPRRDRSVPYLGIFLLRAQTEIVLIYAGLVKLTPDWLHGQPLAMWLRARTDGLWIAPLFQMDWVILTASWGVIALHVLGAPLLLWRRTRLPVFLIYCAFHCANAWFFNIGIFPWLTIAASTIFFLLRAGLARKNVVAHSRPGGREAKPHRSPDRPAPHRAGRGGIVAGGADRPADPRRGLRFRNSLERRRPPLFVADADL